MREREKKLREREKFEKKKRRGHEERKGGGGGEAGRKRTERNAR